MNIFLITFGSITLPAFKACTTAMSKGFSLSVDVTLSMESTVAEIKFRLNLQIEIDF